MATTTKVARKPKPTTSRQHRAGLRAAIDSVLGEYVRPAIDGFKNDPADSDFQRGFLAGMRLAAKALAKAQDSA